MKLKHALQGLLSIEELDGLVQGFDRIGDMAITIIPPELEQREELIAQTILRLHKNIKVVAKRNGNYSGEYRTLPLKIIAGEQRKEVVHKENGIRLYLNPETVYFSVRSAGERQRIASLLTPGEHIAVLCSGIAPYPLILARHCPEAVITGIEKNPIAHHYALKNLKANKKITNVRLHRGDIRTVLPQLNSSFDRILLVLPKQGETLLDTALSALTSGGRLHFYSMQHKDNFDNAVEIIQGACKRSGRRIQKSHITVCGHCAPRTYRICIDAIID